MPSNTIGFMPTGSPLDYEYVIPNLKSIGLTLSDLEKFALVVKWMYEIEDVKEVS